jgi:hypothetical protein
MGGEAPDMGSLPRPRSRPTWDEIDQANQAATAAAEKADRGPSGAAVAFYGEVVVSWESAEPMRLIRKGQLSPVFKDHYVIRVTGLPDMVLKSIEAPELRNASLGSASKKRIAADLAQVKRPAYIEFAFRSRAIPLSVADRSVQFAVSLGQMTIQAHFDLPRMMFRNALAL